MATGRLAVLSNVNMNMVIRMLQKQVKSTMRKAMEMNWELC